MYPHNILICKVIKEMLPWIELFFPAVVAEVLKEHPWPSICLVNCRSSPDSGSSGHHWSCLLVSLGYALDCWAFKPNPLIVPDTLWAILYHLYIYFLLKIAKMDSLVCSQVPWYVYLFTWKHTSIFYNTMQLPPAPPLLSPREVIISLFIHLIKKYM